MDAGILPVKTAVISPNSGAGLLTCPEHKTNERYLSEGGLVFEEVRVAPALGRIQPGVQESAAIS